MHAAVERKPRPLRALSDATLRFDLALGVRRRHAPKVAKNSHVRTNDRSHPQALQAGSIPVMQDSKSFANCGT